MQSFQSHSFSVHKTVCNMRYVTLICSCFFVFFYITCNSCQMKSTSQYSCKPKAWEPLTGVTLLWLRVIYKAI